MILTIEQAAARLGKSTRQIRYAVQKGEIPAQKVGGRWHIDSEDLPLSPKQRQSIARKERQFRHAVETGLGLPDEAPKRYSVVDLKAFQITLKLYRRTSEALGFEHPATAALRGTLDHLAKGCHRFRYADKSMAYSAARDAASAALCELILSADQSLDDVVEAIEQDLMAAIAGLLRRVDRRGKV